ALEARRALVDGRCKAIEAHPNECAEARPRRIVFGEEVTLESVREERLGQIFGVFARLLPVDAQMLVDRAPIGCRHGVPRAPALLFLRATETAYGRSSRRRETAHAPMIRKVHEALKTLFQK